jgi:hydrogenase expression/formation protein HypE
MGKLAPEDLAKLLSCIKKNPNVIVPPHPGYDSGVHRLPDGQCLVISTDPCIGVPTEWFGWLLIHYASSDVALFGAKPQFCTINLLGPPSTSPETFQKIMNQACKAADELGMTIITGHTGTYQGLAVPVGVCTAYGIIREDELITPGGARPGDLILCTKPLGMELAVNFTIALPELAKKIFGPERAKELRGLVTLQSCVKEALLLSKTGYVHAMHDATEGGLTATLNEIAEASKVGFRIDFAKVPILNEALKLQKHFDLSDEQLLSMSSTGTIIASISAGKESHVRRMIEKDHKLRASLLGTFTQTKNRILTVAGKDNSFPEEAQDPYERILSAKL